MTTSTPSWWAGPTVRRSPCTGQSGTRRAGTDLALHVRDADGPATHGGPRGRVPRRPRFPSMVGRHGRGAMVSTMRIGVVLPIADSAGPGRAPTWSEMAAFATQAEAIGLDSLWICDHLLFRAEDGSDEG